MYSKFYGFDGEPFHLTPDERFFFHSEVHKRAMAYLRYGLNHAEGFVVVTGQPGSGKTMLARNLFRELQNTDITAAQFVSAEVGPEDLLRMVCAALGLAHDGMNKATMLHNIEVICRTRCSQGRRTLLVVDEAQNLPADSLEELRLLTNYQVRGRAIFQSFLLGQDRLQKTLRDSSMSQFRQRIIASCHLERLSRDAVKEYVNYRLGVVNWDNDPVLDDGVFDGIFEFSGGLPRAINMVCDRLLFYGGIEGKHRLTGEDLQVVIQDLNRGIGYDFHKESSDDSDIEDENEARIASARNTELGLISNASLQARFLVLEGKVERIDKRVRRSGRLLTKAILPLLDAEDDDDDAEADAVND